jgi:hypothetical protein
MGKRRVNDEGKKNWNKAFHLPFDKTTKVLGDTPSFFRCRNVVKGQFVGNQLIAGWLMTDGSKVISTDSLLIAQRGEDIRGDKYLESKVKIDILVTQIQIELENGVYDPIFGLPLDGDTDDARSIDFVEVVAGADYKFYLMGIEDTDGIINVLQFDENDVTTTIFDEISYDDTLTLESDTVKVKIWANSILVDSSDVPITTYKVNQIVREYKGISEMMDYTVTEEPSQELGAIRKRRNRDITVIKLS